MMDGNLAAAHVAYACSDVVTIYPITPSSTMAEACDVWASEGKKNAFESVVKITEMQSEAGVAGAMHGSLALGALSTTFTASQGLLLMIPNMYKMAGELLPAVFHVSARTVSSHALNIFGDHSDVMATRQTGFNMLASSNPQEAMDIGLTVHLASLKTSLPFLHFFDGFRTSHQINNVNPISYDTIKELLPYDKIEAFKARSLDPSNPHQQGTAQNPDVFFQNREASNIYYEKVPKLVQESFDELYKKTGRQYHLFDYVGHKNPTKLIVIMGSGADTVEETIHYLNETGENLGLVKVRLYRPFDAVAFLSSLPSSVTHISVLDKTKENGSIGEPLYLDVVSALSESDRVVKVLGGRYGLGGKDLTPSMVKAVYDNMGTTNKNHFTVGIVDDVTHTSLVVEKDFHIENDKIVSCKFYGMGGDGTVSANKSAIKIIGENTHLNAQGFFEYDSKKSGNLTISHLRFGEPDILSNYLVNNADFIATSKFFYLKKYDLVSELKQNGVFLINSIYSTVEELEQNLPNNFKKQIAEKNAKLFSINALKLAKDLGLKNKVNTIIESVFFYLTSLIPYEEAKKKMKEQNEKMYSKYGNLIVEYNNKATEIASEHLLKVNYDKTAWKNLEIKTIKTNETNEYYNNVIAPVLSLKGNNLPVSSFEASGYVPTDTYKFEKREIAVECPLWLEGKCIECNQCAFICPHGAIKPVLITEEQAKNLPESFVMKDAKGVTGAKYRMQINPIDCTGCGSCVNVCPTKALMMAPMKEVKEKELDNYYLSLTLNNIPNPFPVASMKGSQFETSYFDASGACSGCGETPYIRLLTQLFGDKMIIANATGCSSIYGGSSPTCPYKKDEEGSGPAWANSLFEDNAEFGFGMHIAYKKRKEQLIETIEELMDLKVKNNNLMAYFKMFLLNIEDETTCKNVKPKLLQELEISLKEETDAVVIKKLKFVKANASMLTPKSFWMIGGDGWAYDINFSGLDHVLASGENVNILVLDTEVYSNTGGQNSKASQTGSVSKFSSSGKVTTKKDLGKFAMNYPNVYVASVAMGGNPAQLVKALTEAEQYDGPSLVIAYSTCINHGIDMSNPQQIMKEAVESGYWTLYRNNPNLKQLGKNTFILDSKHANTDKLKDFLLKQNRFKQLWNEDKETAEVLYEKLKIELNEKINYYKKLAEN